MECLVAETLDFLRSGQITEVECAWIYGSLALRSNGPVNDVDLLVIASGYDNPARYVIPLSNGIPLSVNIIPRDCLQAPDARSNGGFFFNGKLLGPRRRLMGDPHECDWQIARAHAVMIYPWMLAFLRGPVFGNLITVTQLLALLYLARIRVDYCYLRHFAQWFADEHFDEIWRAGENSVRDALNLLVGTPGLSIEPEVGLILRDGLIWSEEQKAVLIQQLVGGFWQFNFHYRGNDHDYLGRYISHELIAANFVAPSTTRRAFQFLREQAPASFPYSLCV